MGIFDTIKSRLGGGEKEEYIDDDEYYDEEEYYDDGQGEAYDDYDSYYDDTVDDRAPVTSSRRSRSFNDHTPLVSMSDVRSQELPRYTPKSSDTRTDRQAQGIRSSLPYAGSPADNLASKREEGLASQDTSLVEAYNNRNKSADRNPTAAYTADDSSDPLLQRHSLSSTGDFSSTSPAYYASRSGTGHVRPSGQARRTQKYRETIVVNPETYAESEQVAVNLRRGNAVVLALTQTRPELAKRILDFSFGAAAVAEGQVSSIGERIYALTCDYPLTETELELLRARGII